MASKFAKDSYGIDTLSKVIFGIGIFFIITIYGIWLGIALIFFAVYRCMSHDKTKRKEEARIFEMLRDNIKFKLKRYESNSKISFLNKKHFKRVINLKQKRNYIVIMCPRCAQKLRIPKGKGKIIVTCSTCKNEFRLKT